MQDHQELKLDFHWATKSKQPASKTLPLGTKGEEIFEKFQENFEIF